MISIELNQGKNKLLVNRRKFYNFQTKAFKGALKSLFFVKQY